MKTDDCNITKVLKYSKTTSEPSPKAQILKITKIRKTLKYCKILKHSFEARNELAHTSRRSVCLNRSANSFPKRYYNSHSDTERQIGNNPDVPFRNTTSCSIRAANLPKTHVENNPKETSLACGEHIASTFLLS